MAGSSLRGTPRGSPSAKSSGRRKAGNRAGRLPAVGARECGMIDRCRTQGMWDALEARIEEFPGFDVRAGPVPKSAGRRARRWGFEEDLPSTTTLLDPGPPGGSGRRAAVSRRPFREPVEHPLGGARRPQGGGRRESREIASFFGCRPLGDRLRQASGTESDNLAVKGVAYRPGNAGKHIVTSRVEHPAIMNTCRFLETQGFRVTYVPVNRQGIVEPDAVRSALTKDTILVSVMAANNETGCLMPIPEIGRLAREAGV